MADRIYTCACGHEERVAGALLGQSTFCSSCGFPFMVGKENTVPAPERMAPAATEAPSEANAAAASPPVAEEADQAEGAPIAAWDTPNRERSPWEAEEADEVVSAPHNGRDGAAAPERRARSGGDAPLPVPPAAPKPAPPAVCGRCERPFRGEWDVSRMEDGRLLCHQCANRAGEEAPKLPDPEEVMAQYEAERVQRHEERLAAMAQRMREEAPGARVQAWLRRHQGPLAVLGIGGFLVGLAVLLPTAEGVALFFTWLAGDGNAADLSGQEGYLLIGATRYVGGIIGWLALLCVLLRWADMLPNVTLPANLIGLLPGAAVLALGDLVLAMTMVIVIPVPVLWVLTALLQVALVFGYYLDWEPSHILKLVMVSLVLMPAKEAIQMALFAIAGFVFI